MRLAVRDPNGSGDGMVAAGSLGEAVWIKRRDGRVVRGAVGGAPADPHGPRHRGRALPDRPGEVGLVPEYALLGASRTAEDAAVLAGTDHTALLRYGWLPTAAAVADPGPHAAALDRLLTALKSPGAAEAYAAAGLRRPERRGAARRPAGGCRG